jgi:hypothetical protein
MTRAEKITLPWSDGLLSASLSYVGSRAVVKVPELGLHCYGQSQAEAVFRLFAALLKYYRQLKAFKHRLGERGLLHLELLTRWVHGMEERMKAPELRNNVLALHRASRH